MVNCELNKERAGRVLALFLWERDVPSGRRFGFWLNGSLAGALRGCDPLSLAEPLASAICYSLGYCWAGLRNTLYVTKSGDSHAKNKQSKKKTGKQRNMLLLNLKQMVKKTHSAYINVTVLDSTNSLIN